MSFPVIALKLEKSLAATSKDTQVRVNSPTDHSEKEADAFAYRVLNGREARGELFPSMVPLKVQRKCQSCEEEIHRKESNSANPQRGADLGLPKSDLQNASPNGRRLPSEVNEEMSRAFGVDFGDVRIHTGQQSETMNNRVNARAFTYGNHIFFNRREFTPHTGPGKHLLAHELTHTLQQRNRPISNVIQRTIAVANPTTAFVNDPTQTNAAVVESWMQRLCPTGSWTVNRTSGNVESTSRGTFCAARPVRGSAHHTTSATPTSCECICSLTAAGSRAVQVHPVNTLFGRSVTSAGEGITFYPGTRHNVGLTGKDPTSITGAGDTSPHSGTGRTQTLRDPAWIILGHEVCGHARNQTAPTAEEHRMNPGYGGGSAIDVENLIRREHSTTTNDFGTRRGEFRDATGSRHFGSAYRVSRGETLSGIATKVGITTSSMLSHIWRENGDAITVATQNTLGSGEVLLIENVFWHQVISGETMSGIASDWDSPLASLIRANPQVSSPNRISVGQFLLIPST